MVSLAGAVIVNPVAGNGAAGRRWPALSETLKAHGLGAEVCLTKASGEATELARGALLAGHDTIIVVGGDGTINEVVNGFFQPVDEHEPQPINPASRLGIICCGTGSDFIRTIGLPRGPDAIAHIAAGQTATIDVGLARFRDLDGRPTARYFLNFADLGLGGETVRRVNHTSKALGGFASFFMGAVQAILSHKGKTIEIAVDGAEPVRRKIGDIVAANGRFFGGGMRVAPEASLTDGLFDLFVLDDVPKHQLLFDLLPRVYRGTHVSHPKVWSQRASKIAVRSTEKLLLDIDGELAGQADAEFSIVPSAIRVIVPFEGCPE